jgi:glycosyltransferase involved in cell wall biosynthesis
MKNIIMILTNGFNPDPRVYKEARTLVDAGHNVEILCWDRENKHIDKTKENLDGIKIKRFFAKSKYGSGYKQIISYLKFIKAVKDYIKDKRFDALHCHDFDGLLIGGILIKNHKNKKLVYDQHDQSYNFFMNRNGIINKIIYRYIIYKEKALLKQVDTHIVVSQNMSKKYNKYSENIIISNAPYRTTFKDIRKENRDKIVIGFIGLIRHYKQLRLLVDCSLNFKENIGIFLAGKSLLSNKLKDYCLKNKISNVSFTGSFEMSELEKMYKKIDITYAVYPETAIISMPNKFFESILTETPMIADINTEFGQIVNDKKFGFVVDSNKEVSSQLKGIFKAIIKNRDILENYKLNMRKEKDKYCWENNIETLLGIYETKKRTT